MKKAILLFLITPAFASVHYVSRTTAPTAQLAYKGVKSAAKLASFPARHSVKTSRGIYRASKAVVKAVF